MTLSNMRGPHDPVRTEREAQLEAERRKSIANVVLATRAFSRRLQDLRALIAESREMAAKERGKNITSTFEICLGKIETEVEALNQERFKIVDAALSTTASKGD